jgi:hypothetical protein
MPVRRADRVSGREDRPEGGAVRAHKRTSTTETAIPQHIWRGASGTLYIHSVTSLVFCPEMGPSTFILLHRDGDGTARVLRVGCLENAAPSLNLAVIRQLGATLGANEVHIRALGKTAADRARVAFDIEHGLGAADNPTRLEAAPRKVHSLA